MGFPGDSMVKNLPAKQKMWGSIPGLGRSPGEGNDNPVFWPSLVAQLVGKIPLEKGTGYPLQLSGLENSMDCTVHEVTKSQTRLSDFHFSFTFTVFLPGKSHGQRSPAGYSLL